MRIGESKSIRINAAEAHGERDESLEIRDVSLGDLPDGPEGTKVGDTFRLEEEDSSGEISEREAVVTFLDRVSGTATIDMNHPLAGRPLTFVVTLLELESAAAPEKSAVEERQQQPHQQRLLSSLPLWTLEQLRKCTGDGGAAASAVATGEAADRGGEGSVSESAGGLLCTSLLGIVYSLGSKGAENFGPGGGYHIFAGRDCTQNLSVMSMSPETLDNFDYRLDKDGLESLAKWVKYFDVKYERVGRLDRNHPYELANLPQEDGSTLSSSKL